MLERLEQLEKAATPGPWVGDRYDGTVKYAIQGPDDALVCHGCNGNSIGNQPYGFQRTEDEEFVMAARNALPALLAVARAAEAYLAEREAPVKCHVMLRQHRNAMESALAQLKEANDG